VNLPVFWQAASCGNTLDNNSPTSSMSPFLVVILQFLLFSSCAWGAETDRTVSLVPPSTFGDPTTAATATTGAASANSTSASTTSSAVFPTLSGYSTCGEWICCISSYVWLTYRPFAQLSLVLVLQSPRQIAPARSMLTVSVLGESEERHDLRLTD